MIRAQHIAPTSSKTRAERKVAALAALQTLLVLVGLALVVLAAESWAGRLP
jgi:hypothetical protein